jgi:hypothetical protein
MRIITNEASMLLKTQEGVFQLVRKQTQDDVNIACQERRLDPANDASVIHPFRPTAKLTEFGPFECGPPERRTANSRKNTKSWERS